LGHFDETVDPGQAQSQTFTKRGLYAASPKGGKSRPKEPERRLGCGEGAVYVPLTSS